MQRERFYIGTATDYTVQEFLKKYDDPFIEGFCEGEDWCVLVDNNILNVYLRESFIPNLERFASVSSANLGDKKDLTLDEFKTEMEKANLIAKQHPIKVDETEVLQKIIYEINDSVLHELSIHLAGNLAHELFLSRIVFGDKKLKKDEVHELIRKYGLKKVQAYLDYDHETVINLLFEEAEAEKEGIGKLYEELKSRNLKLKLRYRKKQYPIKFGLDDIRILDKAKAGN